MPRFAISAMVECVTARTSRLGIRSFTKERSTYVGRSLTLDRLLWNIGRISKSRVIQSKLESMSRLLRLTEIGLKINLHDMQRVYLKKPHGNLQ
jgi:hypothetical protein